MHDKPFIRKLNVIADWLIRIVVLNIFMVFLTLPIITFYAGYKAAYSLFVDYTNGKNTPLFKGFWENLKENFWHDLGVGSLFILLIAIGLLGAYNYNKLLINNQKTLFNTSGFFITLGVSLLLIMTMIFSVTTSYVIKDISLKNLFKVSLILSGKYFLRSFLVLIITVLPIFIIIYPMLALIFIFLGMSGPLILNVLLMRKPRWFLEGGNKNV